MVSVICWSNFAVKGVLVTMSCRRHSEKWRSKDSFSNKAASSGLFSPAVQIAGIAAT